MSSDGRSETVVRRRVQAGANACRQVEGVMSDRHISKKLKGKILGACVTPEMLYGLETLPVSEKHQHRPHLRWRDYIERDMRKAELKDVDWRMMAQDRGQWRRVVHRAAETFSHPYP